MKELISPSMFLKLIIPSLVILSLPSCLYDDNSHHHYSPRASNHYHDSSHRHHEHERHRSTPVETADFHDRAITREDIQKGMDSRH